jgi:hypothetical protein
MATPSSPVKQSKRKEKKTKYKRDRVWIRM